MDTNDSQSESRTSQRVAVLVNQGPDFSFEIQSIAGPTVGPREVLVELEVTGICGTDLGLAYGYLGKANSIIGHEGVGRIVSVGSESSKALVGQRVGVGWLRDACGSCHPCMRGGETHCKLQIFSGRDVAGTLATLAVVPERYVVALPEDLSAVQLAPVMCAGVTAYKALKSSEAIPGSWVAVSGAAGGVGALAVQYAKAMGYRTIAIDGGDGQRQKCLDAGAEIYLDYEKESNLKAAVVRETSGLLCAAAIVCAGSAAAYEAALTCVDYFGTLVCVGIPPPTTKVTFHPLSLIDSGIKIVGSLVGSRADVLEAVEFVRRGLVAPKTVTIGLEELNQHVKKINEIDGKLVVRLRNQ
ncbi:alcohol dehydrogenase [Dactylonectria estremocensis]|uniref:alcohol dehydrogenase n=1 Tax=Dactylonectria estremocensis TaxID=1079267 RepID=A0A9P9IMZ7_9HYPO|nr:alcohol dehydrogenase [Dactylonectria estremocensis]